MLGLLLLNEDAGVSIPMLYDLGSYFAVCKASGLGPTDFVPSAITPLTVVHIHTAHSKRLKGDIYILERVVIKVKKKSVSFCLQLQLCYSQTGRDFSQLRMGLWGGALLRMSEPLIIKAVSLVYLTGQKSVHFLLFLVF